MIVLVHVLIQVLVPKVQCESYLSSALIKLSDILKIVQISFYMNLGACGWH